MTKQTPKATKQEARAAVRAVKAKHPERFTGGSAVGEVEAEIGAVLGDEGHDEVLHVRVPAALVRRIDAYADAASRELFVTVARSAAVRRLLELALAAEAERQRPTLVKV